jgi:hypothetical protein
MSKPSPLQHVDQWSSDRIAFGSSAAHKRRMRLLMLSADTPSPSTTAPRW